MSTSEERLLRLLSCSTSVFSWGSELAGSGQQRSVNVDDLTDVRAIPRPCLRHLGQPRNPEGPAVACGCSRPPLQHPLPTMASRSDQACRACKKQKRRCDKALPECSLCQRTGRVCEYATGAEHQPTARDWGFMEARLTELENRLAGSPTPGQALTSSSTACESVDSTCGTRPGSVTSSFPSVDATPAYSIAGEPGPNLGARFPAPMFLDVDCYIWSGGRLPAPHGAIPAVRCLDYLRSHDQLDSNPPRLAARPGAS